MICLDSSYLVDLLDSDRGRHDDAREWLASNRDTPVYMASHSFWEVLRGAARLDGVAAVEPLATELEWIECLPFTLADAVEAAAIEAELRETGDEISAADYPVAGAARMAGATFVTANPDFERVHGLTVERYDQEQ